MTGRMALAWLPWVLVAVFTVLMWQEWEDKVRAQAEIGVYQEQADSAIRAAEAAEANHERAAQEAQEARDSLRVLAVRLEAATDSLRASVDSAGQLEVDAAADFANLMGQIKVQLPEIAQPLVDSAVAKFEVVQESAETARNAFGAQVASSSAFQQRAEEALRKAEQRAEAAEDLAERRRIEALRERAAKEAAMELATPGVFERVRTSIPFLSFEGTVAGAIGFGLGVWATSGS